LEVDQIFPSVCFFVFVCWIHPCSFVFLYYANETDQLSSSGARDYFPHCRHPVSEIGIRWAGNFQTQPEPFLNTFRFSQNGPGSLWTTNRHSSFPEPGRSRWVRFWVVWSGDCGNELVCMSRWTRSGVISCGQERRKCENIRRQLRRRFCRWGERRPHFFSTNLATISLVLPVSSGARRPRSGSKAPGARLQIG